jgi:hypothetical protein
MNAMANGNWFVRNMAGYKVIMRVLFGVVWLADAWLKWQPAFFSGFNRSYIEPFLSQWDGKSAYSSPYVDHRTISFKVSDYLTI